MLTMMAINGKNLSANFATHFLITNDITISDLDDPNLDIVFPAACFIGAKNKNANNPVTITINLSNVSLRKKSRNVISFLSLFNNSDIRLLQAEKFFSGITIRVTRHITNIFFDIKSFGKIDTFSSKDYAYQDIPAGNMFGEIILSRTGDRSIFTQFSSKYPIYTYEYIEDTSGGTSATRSTRRKSEVYADWIRI